MVNLAFGGENMLYRRIRDLREDKDLTQREMGEILMCSQRVYSNYERGELDIPTEILIKLADFHNVSVDYILNRTDKKNWK
jgi:transcriptional regulator with XRE-family HTH domain